MSNVKPILAELADRAARHYGRSTAEWMEAARAVAEAREVAGHGEWSVFLEHAGIPERTARNMVRLARFQAETISDLGGVRASLDLLSWFGKHGGNLDGLVDWLREVGREDPDDDALRAVRDASRRPRVLG